VQNQKEPSKSLPQPVSPKTDNEKIARATDLARLISDRDYRIFMLVEIGKTRAATDKSAAFDNATMEEAIKLLNHVYKVSVRWSASR
jgi:hypothetical protein